MRYVIGIDEVGRGPLAGPVVVGAVLMPARLRIARPGLRDSKQLSPQAREEWDAYVRAHPRLRFALAQAAPRVIDRLNIARAANFAALRAFRKLVTEAGVDASACSVCLDGGLYLGNGRSRLPARTVVKGDETIPAVSLASIVAKVHRDRLMVRYATRFPGYGLESHKGYATARHREAVRQLGPSAIHRLTFMGKSATIFTTQQPA